MDQELTRANRGLAMNCNAPLNEVSRSVMITFSVCFYISFLS